MRLAGVSARLNGMMSFSRRIGDLPSTIRRVRWPALVTMQSPMMKRSFGLSSICRATFVLAMDDPWLPMPVKAALSAP